MNALEALTMQNVGELAIDTLLDGLKILAFAFVIYFLLSFFEEKIAKALEKNKRWGPFFGSLAGSIPQCGMSVVASDLYLKNHITAGTILAIFIATSDEALPVLLGDTSGKWYMAFAIIGIKIAAGAIFGTLLDLSFGKSDKAVEEHLSVCEGEASHHAGCCGHEIEGESPLHEHLLHPLLHSLKIFAYAYAISFAFGLLIIWVGEDTIASFLSANIYLTPLASLLVGLIPNCASSVLLSDLYVSGALPFGALLTGLAMNAGLGPLYLLKGRKKWKSSLLMMGLIALISLGLGYAFIWVM